MGISGLLYFLKRSYPDLIKSHRKRWGSEGIKNTKVAIDGTLITTRFHFAPVVGELSGKRMIIGWYGLISRMRSHGIRPVVVYDEPGLREWKRAENKKRMDARALQMTRSLHEDDRVEQLKQFQDVLKTINALPVLGQKSAMEIIKESRLAKLVKEFPDQPGEEELRGLVAVFGKDRKDGKLLDVSQQNETGTEPLILPVLVKLLEAILHITFRILTFPPKVVVLEEGDEPVVKPVRGRRKKASVEPIVEETEQQTQEDQEDLDAVETAVADDEPAPLLKTFSEAPSQSILTSKEQFLLWDILRLLKSDSPSMQQLQSLLNDAEEIVLGSQEIATNYERRTVLPTLEEHEEVKELLKAMGVPLVEAKIPYEAEGVASAMALAGMVDWVATEDSDVLAYQAPLLKEITSAKGPIKAIKGRELRDALELDDASFVDCITLMGNDSIGRIPGIGPFKGLTLLKKYGSIEGIFEGEEKLRDSVDEDYLDKVAVSRRMFGIVPPVPEVELEWITPKDGEITAFLEDKHGIRVDKRMESVERQVLLEDAEVAWAESVMMREAMLDFEDIQAERK